MMKRVSLKTGRVIIKSYNINSLLKGHCTLNTGLFQANALYSLSHVLNIVFKLTNFASSIAQLQNATICIKNAVRSNLKKYL